MKAYLPGYNLGAGNRLTQLLARQNINNGTTAGGLGHMLQQGMLGLMARDERLAEQKAQADQTAALQAMAQGMQAKPWDIPDKNVFTGPTGDAQISREEAMKRAAPTGGYEGGLAALSNMPDNQFAGRLAMDLMSKKMDRDIQLQDRNTQWERQDALRADERAWQEGQTADQRAYDEKMQGLAYKRQLGLIDAREAAELATYEKKLSMTPETFDGQPFEVMDQNTGQRVLVERGSKGTIRPVQGYGPTPPNPVPGRDVPFPQNVMDQKVDLARTQGEATASNRPLTADETKSGGFAVRMVRANERLNNVMNGPDGKPGTADDYDPTQYGDAAARGVPFIGNSLQSDQGRQYYQAMSDWVTANLRKESGAVIGVDEMSQEIQKYFPMPGDDPGTIAAKAESRRLSEAAMKTAAGRAFGEINESLGSEPTRRGQSSPKVVDFSQVSEQDLDAAPVGTVVRLPNGGMERKVGPDTWEPVRGEGDPRAGLEGRQSLGVR